MQIERWVSPLGNKVTRWQIIILKQTWQLNLFWPFSSWFINCVPWLSPSNSFTSNLARLRLLHFKQWEIRHSRSITHWPLILVLVSVKWDEQQTNETSLISAKFDGFDHLMLGQFNTYWFNTDQFTTQWINKNSDT